MSKLDKACKVLQSRGYDVMVEQATKTISFMYKGIEVTYCPYSRAVRSGIHCKELEELEKSLRTPCHARTDDGYQNDGGWCKDADAGYKEREMR